MKASTNSSGMLPPPPPPPPPPQPTLPPSVSQECIVGDSAIGPGGSSSIVPSTIADVQGSSSRKGKVTSWVYTEGHFIKEDPKSNFAVCTHCKETYKAHSVKNETSSLIAHLKRCPVYKKKDPKQKSLEFQPAKLGENDKLIAVSFSQDACRKALGVFIIVDEQPFRMVEGAGFREFCRVLEPRFKVPSQSTIRRDVLNLFESEKAKLRSYFKANNVKVCLTTDTWSSLQKMSYMVVTAHFIDIGWKLHKKIIGFFQIVGHTGETIGKMLEACLLDWGLDNVFTITLDNASANNVAIKYVQDRVLKKSSPLVLSFLQVRCAAHVLALVVKDGMKEYHMSIQRIRAVVKYCMSSPARLLKFMDCVAFEKIECKKGLVLDVDTRWNSTFLMLDSAEKYESVFKRLEYDDKAFKKKFVFSESRIPPITSTCVVDEFEHYVGWDVYLEEPSRDICSDEEVVVTEKTTKKRKTPSPAVSAPAPLHAPYTEDWSYARSFVKFLKVFFDFTVKFSASTHVTSHELLFNVSVIHLTLKTWIDSKDPFLSSMGRRMQQKYMEYWGRYEKMNHLMLIVVLLDPREKERGLKFILDKLDITGPTLRSELLQIVLKDFRDLYEEYKTLHSSELNVSDLTSDGTGGDTQSCGGVDEDNALATLLAERAKEDEEGELAEGESEVQLYLKEVREKRTSQMDILSWWKINSTRYPILALMARDILAIPISSVASESAFSTGRRILDPYRSSLLPTTVEALICTQNWLQTPTDLDSSSLVPEEEISTEFLDTLSKSRFIHIEEED